MRLFLKDDALHVPSALYENQAKLGLKNDEFALILHAYSKGIEPGDTHPAPSVAFLARHTGMSKPAVKRWKRSLERKGYLIATPKKIGKGQGKPSAAYWDLTPLWAALDALAGAQAA